MDKQYYLHRISYEGNVSYSLLENGYLTLGWGIFAGTRILEAARESTTIEFEKITQEKGCDKIRSRWAMWYFAQMKVDDCIVVPLYDGKFSVYEIEEPAKSISELEKELDSLKGMWDKHEIIWQNHMLYDNDSQREIDLGFCIKVKPVIENALRKYCDGKLTSRMKIRNTTANISDLADNICESQKAWEEKRPISLYDNVIDDMITKLQKEINEKLDPDKFENLIKWYMKKCGASSFIPAKNEPGKKDGADADIIAAFDNLKFIVYVQAKWHVGTTEEWAVLQIANYKLQKCEDKGDPGYKYASWVISSADSFSQLAVKEAEDRGVRLINGKEFAKLLIDAGLLNIDDAWNNV